MALDHNDFVELSRIEDALRRSDPELASKLSARMDRRPLRVTISYVVLSVFALLTMAGLAIGLDSAPSSTARETATYQRHERPATTPPVSGPRGAAAFIGQAASAAAPGVSH